MDKIYTMRKTLLTLFLHSFIFYTLYAQFIPGMFYPDLGNSYNATNVYPCAVDSSFYIIRYGGLERFSKATGTETYLWDRFYNTSVLKTCFGSSLILLKANKILRYFPAQDSVANVSGSLPNPSITDIDAAQSSIWAISNFNQLGRYDSMGWQVLTLSGSYNPSRIIAINDSSVYLTDNMDIRVYASSQLSAPIYTFSTSGSMTDWGKDTAGNLWMLADGKVIKLAPSGAANFFPSNSSPFNSTGTFTHLATDINGRVWVSTTDNSTLYRYSGTSWFTYNFSIGTTPPYLNTQAMATDRNTGLLFIQSQDSLYTLDTNNVFVHYSFSNMPYRHIKAVGDEYIANDQGIYTINRYQYPRLLPTGFKDTSSSIFANDVTCFVVNSQNIDSGYGTHHGVYKTLYPINNANLPDTNITYIYFASGTYYIGTTKGLCMYNQVVYTTFDTTNSGLPSNNITFIISYLSPYTSAQELWVGTDRGVALYTNGHWSRYDTSVVHVPNFYVSGILPCPFYYLSSDSTVWISTLGSGLVKLRRDSSYYVLNTANGGCADDSLYFVIQIPGCEYIGTAVVGTNAHGIAFLDVSTLTFVYDSIGYYNGGSVVLHRANFFSNIAQSYGESIIYTDAGMDYIGQCQTVGLNNASKDDYSLKWHQEDENRLWIAKSNFIGSDAAIDLYDMTGQKIGIQRLEDSKDRIYLDISSLAGGLYILHERDVSGSGQTKLIISK